MGRNASRRMRVQLRMPFEATLNNPQVKLWIALGQPSGSIPFAPHGPTMTELRKLAHEMAEKFPDRTFRYGYDKENDPYIEVL